MIWFKYKAQSYTLVCVLSQAKVTGMLGCAGS